MEKKHDIETELLKLHILLLLKKRANNNACERNVKRWGVRPILRDRKKYGEYYTTFIRYKVIDHEWFFFYTRMTTMQFDEVLSIVGPSLVKNSCREALCPAQRLAITLRFLSQGDSLFSIASGYKIGRSTVSVVIKETTNAIWEALHPIVLKPLIEEDFKKISKQFLWRWNMPHTLGAIDGKHVAINCPPCSGSAFYNYKKHFSIILLAICDAHYNFQYVNIGEYGAQSDGGVLANSSFGKALENLNLPIPGEEYLPHSKIKLPYFFVGDDAFPLGKHLMKPYKGANLSKEKMIFNYRLSRARRVIENAFGILVARWRIFTRTISSQPATVDNIIKAAVCLHNFIKKKEYSLPDKQRKYCSNSFCDRETDDGIMGGEWRREVGDKLSIVLKNIEKRGKGGNNPGKQPLLIRDNLAQYLISPAGAIPGQIEYVKRGKLQV